MNHGTYLLIGLGLSLLVAWTNVRLAQKGQRSARLLFQETSTPVLYAGHAAIVVAWPFVLVGFVILLLKKVLSK